MAGLYENLIGAMPQPQEQSLWQGLSQPAQAPPQIRMAAGNGYANGEYASSPEEHINDVRKFGEVRGDPNQPSMMMLLKNLPPDIEVIHDGGGTRLRLKGPSKSGDLIS